MQTDPMFLALLLTVLPDLEESIQAAVAQRRARTLSFWNFAFFATFRRGS